MAKKHTYKSKKGEEKEKEINVIPKKWKIHRFHVRAAFCASLKFPIYEL